MVKSTTFETGPMGVVMPRAGSRVACGGPGAGRARNVCGAPRRRREEAARGMESYDAGTRHASGQRMTRLCDP